jgi:hypothetical protein
LETMREYLALTGNKNHSSVRHVTQYQLYWGAGWPLLFVRWALD